MDVLLILACRDAHSIVSSISSYLNAKMTWKSVVLGDSIFEQSAPHRIIHPRKSFLRGLLACRIDGERYAVAIVETQNLGIIRLVRCK